MKSLSNLGIGLSLVFGCLLLALVAELYYLLWWKKRITNNEIEEDYSTSARELFYLFCWKKPSSLSSTALNPQEVSVRIATSDAHDLESNGKDFLLKPFGEESMEAELMRLHNLSGPPRFLFTIKEETKEDLESEDGKSRKGSRGRSLSDLILSVETPYLTPLSSPPFFTPPLTPMEMNYNHHGFNPLFESSTDAEINRIKSSPPPKFKFMKDAEEKLYRRTVIEEAEKYVQKDISMDDSFDVHDEQVKVSSSSSMVTNEEDGSFITIFVDKNELPHHHHHSSSSQVLPLSTSPSTIRPVNKKSMFHWSSED